MEKIFKKVILNIVNQIIESKKYININKNMILEEHSLILKSKYC